MECFSPLTIIPFVYVIIYHRYESALTWLYMPKKYKSAPLHIPT